ncbi:hypothetical protein J6590_051808 [Homalodisca vitripennis]|nr:hypothetical protein J6590_051808 [Homalodisca vitripennis]
MILRPSEPHYSRGHEIVHLAGTNRMDRPTRRCHIICQLSSGTVRCGYRGEQDGNVAQSSLAAPRSRANLSTNLQLKFRIGYYSQLRNLALLKIVTVKRKILNTVGATNECIVRTNKMDRPARRCHKTRRLLPSTAHCGVSGEQVWQRRSVLIGCSKVKR